ncbi:uncharacterized protein EKO05_0009109 [Ascochyta rabiei]|uniref:uncharacterized protein n=1 Tax=Didymella rabiei TaxID=5454 RepID=UPI002204B3E6|nr:uncharacterized protein EKO05_0009109 [Ascochyta rabiei]UPX18820.1 hypothetical protein EKO05_0009109 [Ascochyta rabiei]
MGTPPPKHKLKEEAWDDDTILFAAQSNGDLSTLSLSQHEDSYNLSVTSTTRECGGNPSWLNIDSAQRLLYCLDRGQSNATKGSLNLFRIGEKGLLSSIDRVDAPFSGVAAEYFDVGEGKRGYVTASYTKSAIAAFLFPKNGSLSPASQTIHPTHNITGPIASRQDDSYSHHVILDPTHPYILIPDLGADLIRVFTYTPGTVAPLTELEPLKTESGAGPRHGVFWQAPGESGAWYLLFNGELSQKVYSYRVTYSSSGLAWEPVSESAVLGELGETLPPNTAPTSEIAVSPDQRFVVISSREHSFPTSLLHKKKPSDSLATFSIQDDGSLRLVQIAPSGGHLPRQFSINKRGDKVAVGHQGNSTVVVLERDISSGEIGGKVADVNLRGPVVFVGWDE